MRWAFVAGALYLVIALWHVRVVLPAPSTLLPINPSMQDMIPIGDQEIVVATIARGARLLPTEPSRIYDGGQCYPMPNAITLGEHIIGNGLLAIVPYWLSGGEPVFAANAVYVLEMVIAGVGMFALVLHFTGSVGPALVAGFLFGFLPTRLQDPGHPFLHGNQWAPFVLLFLHRVFSNRRWSDAGWLALFVCLQLLESFYQVWALTLLVAVYGTALAIRHRQTLVRVAPLLAAGVVVASGLAYVTLGPYLATARAWGILGDRGGLLLFGSEVLPGGTSYPGTLALALGTIALLDRLRGRRRPDDPRFVFLVMGVVITWAVVGLIPVPFVGPVPSLSTILMSIVPGLKAGRGVRTARLGIFVVTCFLAGYGLFVLTANLGRRVRAAILAAVGVLAFAEMFVPAWAAKEFFLTTALVARTARPDAELVALYEHLTPGPVLDVPYTHDNAATLRDQAHYTFLGGYHHQQTGSCYNSNAVPIQRDVAALADQMPSIGALNAVHSLGFRTIVVHGETGWPKVIEALLEGLDARVRAGDLRYVGSADRHHVYTIVRAPAPAWGPPCLQVKGNITPPLSLPAGATGEVPFEFRSAFPLKVCRQRDPLVPVEVMARWREQAGKVMMGMQPVRVLLPIAVAAVPPLIRSVPLRLPPPGRYIVTLTAQSHPHIVVAQRTVVVISQEGPPPPPAT